MTLSDDEIDNILQCLKDNKIKHKCNLREILKNYNKNQDIIEKLNDDNIELDNDLEFEEEYEIENKIYEENKNYEENDFESLIENDDNINNTKNDIDRLDNLIKETEEKIKNNIKEINNLYKNNQSIDEKYESMSQKYKNFNFSDAYKSQFNHKLNKNKFKSATSKLNRIYKENEIIDDSDKLEEKTNGEYSSKYSYINIPENNNNPYNYRTRYLPHRTPYQPIHQPPMQPPEHQHPIQPPEHQHPMQPPQHQHPMQPPQHHSGNYDYLSQYYPYYSPPPPHSNLDINSQRYPYLHSYNKRNKNNISPLMGPVPNMNYDNRPNNIPFESMKDLDNDLDKGNCKTIVKDYVLLPGESNSKLIDLISQDLLNEIDGLKGEPLQPSDDKYSVRSLFEKFKEIKNKKMNISKYDKDELLYYDSLDNKEKDKIDKIEEKISKLNNIITPLRFRVLKSNIPLHNKAMIINKIEDLFSNKLMGGSEITKYSNWVNSLLKIPFKKYKKLPIDAINSSDKDIGNYLVDVKKTLDTAVYGHTNTKEQIIQIIAQWISNPSSTGNCIGIEGVMGNGKTTLVKNGIAKAIDRPFAFITLGGCSDSSFLEGHNYTYEGSMWGKIADILIQCKCMNPVFYFDELDKVSETPKGEEIINTLIHLTDSSQNSQFTDKYFNGVNLDLSKSLFIFSYNDKSKINPILLDRLICIKTDNFKTEDKIEIAKNYLLKDIFSQLTLDENKYKISDENLEYIIEKHTEEGGVRTLKKHLFSIFSKLNLLKLTKHDENIKYSFDLENNLLEQDEIDKKIIDSLIKDGADKDDEYYKTFYM